MCSLPCFSLPIRVDHSRNTKLIFRVAPAESHHHVWCVFIVNSGVIETEGTRHRLFRENDSGEICLLQEFDETMGNLDVVAFNIKQNRAAVSDHYDISAFRLIGKFGLRAEAGIAKNCPQINRSFDCGEAMIRNHKDVCCFAHP